MVHLTTGQRPTAAGESHANGRGGYISCQGPKTGNVGSLISVF